MVGCVLLGRCPTGPGGTACIHSWRRVGDGQKCGECAAAERREAGGPRRQARMYPGSRGRAEDGAAFFNTLKSKTGLMVARAAALRTNINIDGRPLPTKKRRRTYKRLYPSSPFRALVSCQHSKHHHHGLLQAFVHIDCAPGVEPPSTALGQTWHK